MNHFELFNLPVALDIDFATLKAEFLKLQQQYHPDKAEDKDQALIKSSEINQAFKQLFTQSVVKYKLVIPIFLFIFLAPFIGMFVSIIITLIIVNI